MKGRGAARKIIGAGIVLAGFLLLCFWYKVFCAEKCPGRFPEKRMGEKAARNGGQIQQAHIEAQRKAWEEMWERVLQEQQQRSIIPWQGEKDFPDAVYRLMREEAWTGLYGEPNMLLENHRVDLAEGTESFMQMVLDMGEGNIFGHCRDMKECKWAYRWTGEDGSENFLTCINYGFAKDSIQWWKVAEGRLEEYDYITEHYDPSHVISCEGQVYCLTEAVPDYRGGSVYAEILEVGDGEKWRTACFCISADVYSGEELDFACIPLYEEEGLPSGVKDYVQGRCGEIVSACRNVKLLSHTEKIHTGKGQGFAADVDNDGIVEYWDANYTGCLDVTFYEMENGELHSIPFEELLPWDGAGLLAEALVLRQLWCEKLGDTTYLFTVDEMLYSPDLILRTRVLKGDYVEDKAVYLLKLGMSEDYRERELKITPSAEGVG